MSIPKWRAVRDADDGCEEYECLNCYRGWVGRSSDFIYCPYCGIKFEGEEGSYWDEEKYAWQEKLWDHMERNRKQPRAVWLIQRRFFSSLFRDEIPKWEDKVYYDVEKVGARKILEIMRRELKYDNEYCYDSLDDEPEHWEYRVKLLKYKDLKKKPNFGYSSYAIAR